MLAMDNIFKRISTYENMSTTYENSSATDVQVLLSHWEKESYQYLFWEIELEMVEEAAGQLRNHVWSQNQMIYYNSSQTFSTRTNFLEW